MSSSEIILELSGVGKSFNTPDGPLPILKNVTVTITRGEKVAIIGPSGSGKSTLLSLIGLLDTPTEGTLVISGVTVADLSEAKQADFRNQKIGFIFQSFELISPFTVAENISAPLDISGKPVNETLVQDLILSLGLQDRTNARPQTLSGGEKQRVAIGRALINQPDILLADEPTGSLDRATGEKVLDLLLGAVATHNTTLIIITHDESIAARMDRVFTLQDKTIHERP